MPAGAVLGGAARGALLRPTLPRALAAHARGPPISPSDLAPPPGHRESKQKKQRAAPPTALCGAAAHARSGGRPIWAPPRKKDGGGASLTRGRPPTFQDLAFETRSWNAGGGRPRPPSATSLRLAGGQKGTAGSARAPSPRPLPAPKNSAKGPPDARAPPPPPPPPPTVPLQPRRSSLRAGSGTKGCGGRLRPSPARVFFGAGRKTGKSAPFPRRRANATATAALRPL
jgi:hypothetical protein